MKRSKDELLNLIKDRIGEDTSDEALGLVEDISDTLDDYESRAAVDWENKYKENDKMWREKYRDRFYSGESKDDPYKPDEEEKPKRLTFEELFKEE